MDHDFSEWVGRSENAEDLIEPSRSNALLSTLGHSSALADGNPLPLLHHWLYFWNVQPPAALGGDGHPAKGGFLPPVPLPRRMWAGGRLQFHQPLRIGERARKVSTIDRIETKTGRSGTLVFVTVRHELSGDSGPSVTEHQDLVYREPAAPGSISAPLADDVAPQASWHEALAPDSILLFRYSALTMNGHRIHYDLPYARDEEAYPALVVHGPLQATALLALAARNLRAPVKTFAFRGEAPAFSGATLHLCGEASDDGAALWSEQGGIKRMSATVTC